MKAFPTHKEEGMDLRDYFAAKSIQPAFDMLKSDLDSTIPEGYEWGDAEDFEEVAKRAYQMADAMMKERTIERN